VVYIRFAPLRNLVADLRLFKQLLTNPKAETLIKANEIELLRHCIYNPAEVDKYWNSIKIAIRHGYKVDDAQMWMDYVKMLDTMGRDLNSPTLLMPNDLQAAHDLYVKKVNRKREQERREADLQKAIKEETTFQELKSKFFGLEMTDGEIDLHSIDSISQYYEIGQKMSICVFSSRYYLKEKSLVLTAVKSNKIVGVVEISLEDYSILQCRAFANGICEYQDRIAKIISDNTKQIDERKTA
ncbi:MAG: PcfJ domain-containing protein, partial [Muribaculum sp.]|nr:PcfJ domain-containing protein [Muribaculum sp.]